MNNRLISGVFLLVATSLLSLTATTASRILLKHKTTKLNPGIPAEQLWHHYRWSANPVRRREAALLLAATEHVASRKRRLLAGQGWGRSPEAAIALLQQTWTAAKLGLAQEARQQRLTLLKSFPDSAIAVPAFTKLITEMPGLRGRLRQRFPAHPDVLQEAWNAEDLGAAAHLGRWQPKGTAAVTVLLRRCRQAGYEGPSEDERQELSQALAESKQVDEALNCLRSKQPRPATALAVGRELLRGNRKEKRQGEQILVALAQIHPQSKEALEAAKLLSEPLQPRRAVLSSLPRDLAKYSASFASGLVRLNGGEGVFSVLQRWPDDPASWQLQWDVAREALLAGKWEEVMGVLQAIPMNQLPEPLEKRRQFWLGLAMQRLEREEEARDLWQNLIISYSPGYYTWRANVRLGGPDLPLLRVVKKPHLEALLTSSKKPWQPLNSGNLTVDTLWRLGYADEALVAWLGMPDLNHQRSLPRGHLVEGRLRFDQGDHWRGLSHLWLANLRLVDGSCKERQLLHHSQHPLLFLPQIGDAALRQGIRPELLLAVARQESYFTPEVISTAGAVGLMQLMPATAADLEGRLMSKNELRDPAISTSLGSRYLTNLLRRWDDNPWLAVASYNAGPSAVDQWRGPELALDPELWVERIPYAETRLYTKKVLGNLWSYLRQETEWCREL